MSIWTDLLLLAGHAATPRAVAAIAPELFPAAAAPSESARDVQSEPANNERTHDHASDHATHDRAAARRTDDAAREDLQPQLVRRPTPAPALPRAVARSGRISPNDLFW